MTRTNPMTLVAASLLAVGLLTLAAGTVAAQEAPDGPPNVTVEVGDEEVSTADDNESDDGDGDDDGGDGGEGPPEDRPPRDPGEGDDGDGDEDEEDELLNVHNGVVVEGYGGEMHIDCTGDALDGHHCDKGGYLDAEAAAIDYDGSMGGPISAFAYEFDDYFVVTVANESSDLVFRCDEMNFDDLTCTVDSDRFDDDGGDDGVVGTVAERPDTGAERHSVRP